MTHDAREIANFFLDYAEVKKLPLTNLSLLKLIYFAHGWHLARLGRPLVKNHFEAWEFGPVVRVVYQSFKGAGNKPITNRAHRYDPITGACYLATYQLDQGEQILLTQVFEAFAHLHAFKLSEISHEQGSPWYQIWETEGHKVNPGMRISNESIKAHFLRKHQNMSTH